jgi:hypothetical protein
MLILTLIVSISPASAAKTVGIFFTGNTNGQVNPVKK